MTADTADADQSAALETFGYKQELKRSLSPFDLLVYGLVFITPIAPWSSFGFVYNASHGMVPLVYVVGLVAMVFTALSYMTMSAEFPVAGSVYAYAGRGINETVGFLSGWAILLDYLLLPTLVYVVCAIAVHAVAPVLPKAGLVVLFIAVNTAINLFGIESIAKFSVAMLVAQLILLALFAVLCVMAISHGTAGAHWSIAPLYDAHKVTPSVIFGALSLAVLSFLGFDAISTLSEEARGGARDVGWATMASLLLAAAVFIAQTYLASLFVLNRVSFAEGDEAATAFLIVAKIVGGEWFRWLASIVGLLASGMAGALTAQAATARLLYSMARDGLLFRALAHVSARRQTPDRAVLLTAAISVICGVFMVDRLELLTSMVNFGALTGFLALHASVIYHFVVRRKSRRWGRHLIIPAIGFAIIAYVLINAEINAKIAGAVWMTIGCGIILGLRLTGRRTPPLLEEET